MLTRASVCAFAILACTAGQVAAQNQLSERFTANAMLGVGQSRAGTSFDTIGAVGIKAHPNVQLVGEVGTLEFKRFISSSQIAKESHRALRFGANVMYTYAEPRLVQPYLLAGFGALRTKTDAGDSLNNAYGSLGLGFDFWTTDWLGVGMQYRAYFVDQATIHYFNGGIKIGLR